MEYKYRLTAMIWLLLFAFSNVSESVELPIKDELTGRAWVQFCLEEKEKYLQQDSLFVVSQKHSKNVGHNEDTVRLAFDGGLFELTRSMSKIDLNLFYDGEVVFTARSEKNEILNFERMKLDQPKCDPECEMQLVGYKYAESLINASLSFTPSELQCNENSKEQDTKLFALFETKKIALAGLGASVKYYILSNHQDGRFEVHERSDAVVVYVEYIEGDYRTNIFYKKTGKGSSEMLNVLIEQFLN